MPRLIDADMLEPSEVYMDYGFTRIVYMDDIDEMPTVDAEPVRHGHWIVSDSFAECSCCGMVTTRNELMGISLFGKNEPNYCPNCGARMDEEDV